MLSNINPPCALCNNKKLSIAKKLVPYTLYYCVNCQVIFTHPQPEIRDIGKNNLSQYESDQTEKTYLAMEDKFRERARRNTREMLDLLRQNYNLRDKTSASLSPKALTLLDVGCSFGFYLDEFKKAGFTASGIDSSPKAVGYVKKRFGIPANTTTIEDFRAPKGGYDVITLFDVIEHLTDPGETITRLRTMLAPGGILLMQTPNYDSLISRLTGTKWYWLLIPHHLFLFSPVSLPALLERKGYRVLSVYTWDDWWEFTSNLISLTGLSPTGKTARLHRICVKLLQPLSPITSFWNSLLKGGELTIYAQKV